MKVDARPDLEPEQRAALNTVRQLVDFWRIQPHELEGDPPAPSPSVSRAASPRYRHPVTGETWDGQGPHPDWLRQALLKEGYTVEELRRAVQQAAPEPALQSSNGSPT